jgi:glutathione S-transferase
MEPPVLWHFPISHFNEKARWALDFKAIPHRRRALGPSYLLRAWWATGRANLPILFLEGEAIGDSTRIIEAVERYRPEPPLYPKDESGRRRALMLEDFFDENLGHPIRTAVVGPLFIQDADAVVRVLSTGMGEGARRGMRSIFPAFRAFYRFRHKIDPDTIKAAPGKIRAALDRIEAELQPSGYLVGDRFSVADLTAAALFGPVVLPPEWPYPPPGPIPRPLTELRASIEGHRAYQWVIEMYRRHRGASKELAP